jgi:hypothetical protein
MGKITTAPQSIEDAIFADLQDALLPARLNQDRPENLSILLRWANEEYNKNLFSETSTPAQIATVLMKRIVKTPQSLIWDQPLDLTPAPKTRKEIEAELLRTQQEYDAKQLKRQLQEKLENENSEAAFFERGKKIEAEKAATKLKKDEETAKVVRHNAVMTYEVYKGPGRVDATRTEDIRKALFTVAVRRKDGTLDEQQTTKSLLQIISRLPDDATAKSVAAVIHEMNRDAKELAARPKQRDSFGYDTKFVVR